MSGNLKYCISLLQDNDENIKKEAEFVLAKLCGNIIKNPQDSRYRKIKLTNAIVSSKLLPASGAIECLFEAGFVEGDDGFLLPINASLAGVKELYSLLSDRSQAACPQSKPPAKYQKQENTFLLHLTAHFRSVLRYEEQSLQNKARAILPLERLQISAMEKLREIQKQSIANKQSDDIVFEDLLLVELLSWFKLQFFKWVDTLACDNCTGECYNDGSRVSSDPRISRIEIHKCKSCRHENEFPRYTDPEILLYTRRGRCGEWANCFTLICRSVGLDARLIYDETDHVWTEVWSVAHNRWIHADACENLMDRPLVYEKGWGKKLSYVIAFSRDEIQDVTWRYTRQREQVMGRRKYCSEEALVLLLRKLNDERQIGQGYSAVRRKFVAKRRALELAEMLDGPPGQRNPDDSDSDYTGRTSGSLAWRLSRGELATAAEHRASQWCVPAGISTFRLTYDVVRDAYTTIDAVNERTLETRQHWQTGIDMLEGSIIRKQELDWKMVYLARLPGSDCAKLSWTFRLADASKTYLKSLKLQAKATTFSNGKVEWRVEALLRSAEIPGQNKRVLLVDDCRHFETTELQDAVSISISATLSGGTGDVAWQHAQLFRRSLDEPDNREACLLIELQLENRVGA